MVHIPTDISSSVRQVSSCYGTVVTYCMYYIHVLHTRTTYTYYIHVLHMHAVPDKIHFAERQTKTDVLVPKHQGSQDTNI